MNSHCIIVPNYNHARGFPALVDRMLASKVPVIVVNDGSDAVTTAVLRELETQRPEVEVLHFPRNRGKGAAVIAGMRHAQARGISHALQIDADGQHDLGDLDKFLELSRAHPQAVICGCPIYDESVPTYRKLFRYLTHNLVWLQTLSFTIRDSMCGFRVYPLAAVAELLEHDSIGQRMDFDIEIAVKLYWQGVEIIPVRTKVIYPKDGSSNYRMWADNWILARMHTRLLGGMLLRLPGLLGRHHDRHRARRASHWARIAERGSSSGLKLLLWIYQHLGRWIFLLILHPVVLYYVLSGGSARRASKQYWQQLGDFEGTASRYSFFTLYKHFYAFGEAAIDKIASWSGEIRRTDVIVHGEENFREILASGKGAVFVGSHLGNLELCRALGEKGGRFRINAVVFHKNALKFQQVLGASAPEVELNLIHVETIGIDTAIVLKQKVDAGEIVIIVGDRTPVNQSGRVHYASFLGRLAPFSEGPFVLASILQCPVYLIFGLKEQGIYNVYLERFSDGLRLPRAERAGLLAATIEQYARRLEYFCTRCPLQWFNFFDFWQTQVSEVTTKEAQERL